MPHILLCRTPTVGWVLLCGTVSAQILRHILLDRVAPYSFLSYLWRKFLLTESALATRCHLIKINLLFFPLTVSRSLSFLIPSFTKVNMSSNPVVHLPLTYASGLLGVCHRDGSLAVLFPSLVGDSANGSIPLTKAQVASPLEWALVSCPVLQAD